MSVEHVQKIIGRAVTEPEYRALLFSDPATALASYLKEGLVEALKPDGVLIVSGFVESQVEVVHAALQEAGLGIAEQRRSKNWVALIARKKGK